MKLFTFLCVLLWCCQAQWQTAILSSSRQVVATSVGTQAVFAGYDSWWNASMVDILHTTVNEWAYYNLSEARTEMTGLTSVGNATLFAGGRRLNGEYSDTVDIYDANAETWGVAQLYAPRSFIAATSVGNKAFFAGGRDLGNVFETIDIYNVDAGTWSTNALSIPRSHIGAASVGTKVLFAGGYDPFKSLYFNTVDIYDSATNTWSTESLSQARYGVAATTYGTKAFFAGGYSYPEGFSDVVDIYDAATGEWEVATLYKGRTNIGAATVGPKVFFAGGSYIDLGTSTQVVVNVADVYDAVTGDWTTSTLALARSNIGATAVGYRILFAGGLLADGTPTNLIDVYDYTPAPGTPAVPAAPAAPTPGSSNISRWSRSKLYESRFGIAAAHVGNKAFFAGGMHYTFPFDGLHGHVSTVVDIYDSGTKRWSHTNMKQPRNMGVAASAGNMVIFAGGYNDTSASFISDIEIYDTNTNMWSLKVSSSVRQYLAAASAGTTKALFAGSYLEDDSTRVSVIDIYDSKKNTWIENAQTPANLTYFAATTIGSCAIFVGSPEGVPESVSVDIYNSTDNEWYTANGTLSQARTGLAVASLGNKAYFAGGSYYDANQSVTVYSDVVDIYDLETNSWSTATLSRGRTELTATSLGKQVFFAGGQSGPGSQWEIVDIYNEESDTWYTARLSFARSQIASTSAGDKALFAGGVTDAKDLLVVDIYEDPNASFGGILIPSLLLWLILLLSSTF